MSVLVCNELCQARSGLRYRNYDTWEILKISAKSGLIDYSLSAQFNRTSLAASDAALAEIQRFVFHASYDSVHAPQLLNNV